MAKQKHSFKEKWGSFRNFAKGEPLCAFMGDSYIEKTNIMNRREWRGFVDTAYDFGWWLGTWGKMSGLIMRDPIRMLRAFWSYRWLSAYLCTPAMVDRWTSGDRGIPLRADHHAINAMVSDSIDTIWKLIRADRRFGETKWTARTIGFDYTLPKHIMFGFPGYEAINIQQHPAFMVPIMNKHYGCYYVDQAVSTGIPQDMCTLPLVEVGVAVEDEYPDIGNCYMSTNNPCDANMMDNAAMYRRLSGDGKKAVHAFVTPLMYDDPTTKELGVHEIYSAIGFLEEQFGQKFNWDAFAEGMRHFNELNIHETNKWDVYAKCDNIAINSCAQSFWRIYMYQQGANKHFEREAKKVWKYFEKCLKDDIKPFKYRHRALAWSCGSTYYDNSTNWLYQCWGIMTVINMDSLTGHNIVDTENRDEMMSDLADLHARTPMRTHTVGGNRHILMMFETAAKFNCDMIVMYDDIGCKGMAGCQGLLEEEFRKHPEFHIMWMPHALMDCRTVPTAEARKVVNDYMTTVLHEEPVDPSLVDFDDSEGW